MVFVMVKKLGLIGMLFFNLFVGFYMVMVKVSGGVIEGMYVVVGWVDLLLCMD